MIKIDDYYILNFINWIKKNDIQIEYNEQINLKSVEHITNQYLMYNCKSWNIKFILRLFQNCIKNNYQIKINKADDILYMFHELFKDNESVYYLDTEIIDKNANLHPLFENFFLLLKETMHFNEINDMLTDIAIRKFRNNQGLIEWINDIPNSIIIRIQNEFKRYLNNPLNIIYFDEFRYWIKDERINRHRPKKHNRDSYSFEARRRYFIKVFIKKQDMIYTKILYSIVRSDKLVDNEFYYIDFIHFINKLGYNYNKNIPSSVFNKLIDDFANENQLSYKVKKKLLKLNSKRKTRLVSKLINKFKTIQGKDFSIERTFTPKLHGTFLFRTSNNLEEFIKVHWENLHHLTGDHMDIYYSDRELKDNVSCYEKINKLVYVSIDEQSFPSLLVWDKTGTRVKNVELKQLSFEEIVDVVEVIINNIKKNDFDTTFSRVDMYIDKIKSDKKNINYNIEHSQIGAIGYNATAKDINFTKV